ncbi:hypothetical protein [Tabrizicola sp.]|uniref:hypothetical protein n=1 Tax=Tabrizicola sp. TaxID=2005166 RepID=UPI003F38AEC3
MALWFWTILISAPFGYAAYHQAANRDWKIMTGALPLLIIGLAYILFMAPEDFWTSREAFRSHPDLFKFKAAVFASGAGILSVAAAVIGNFLRNWLSPLQVGLAAFFAAFVPLNLFFFVGGLS